MFYVLSLCKLWLRLKLGVEIMNFYCRVFFFLENVYMVMNIFISMIIVFLFVLWKILKGGLIGSKIIKNYMYFLGVWMGKLCYKMFDSFDY